MGMTMAVCFPASLLAILLFPEFLVPSSAQDIHSMTKKM